MTTHQLQNRSEYDPPGANTVFQPFKVGCLLKPALGCIERDHERRVKTCGAEWLDQKRCGMKFKKPFQAARRLRSDQCNDRRRTFPGSERFRFDWDAIGIQYDHVDRFVRSGLQRGVNLCE